MAQRSGDSAGQSEQLSELRELKKEVIDARSLIIKTDNLVKNLSADIKQMQRRMEALHQRSVLTSVAAYVIFVLLIGTGSWAILRYRVEGVREQLAVAEKKATEAEASERKMRNELEDAEHAHKKALGAFEMLEGGKLKDALSALESVDKDRLTDLERKALHTRERSLRLSAAEAAYDTGRALARSERFAEAIPHYDTALEMAPSNAANRVQYLYMRGYAHFKKRAWEKAITDNLAYLKLQPPDDIADDGLYFLGYAYERLDKLAEAKEALSSMLAQHPRSSYASAARNRLRAVERKLKSAPAPQ